MGTLNSWSCSQMKPLVRRKACAALPQSQELCLNLKNRRSFKHEVVGADFEIALRYKITLEQIIQLYEPLVANFTKKLVCLSTLRSLDLVKVQIGPFLSSTQLVRPENAGQEVCGKSICHCTTSSGKKAWKPSASKKR